MMVALVIFFVVLHYVEHADDFLDAGATFQMVFLGYYPSFIPEIIKLVSPLAVFLSCLFLVGRLSQEVQLVALQTSGVSLYRILLPFVLVGLTLTGFMFWFNGWVVPKANQERVAFESQFVRRAGGAVETSNIHRQNRPGSILAVGYFDRDASVGYRVSLQSFDGTRRLEERIDAETMTWDDSLNVWRMSGVIIRSFDDAGLERRTRRAELDTVLQVYPRDIARTERDAELLTIPAAAEYVDALRRSGAANIGRPLVEYYAKFAYPMANLILVLVGVPLAAVRRRGGQTIRIAIGLLISFVYLAMIKLAEPFGYSGELDPLLAATLPHAFFFVLGLILLFRARK